MTDRSPDNSPPRKPGDAAPVTHNHSDSGRILAALISIQQGTADRSLLDQAVYFLQPEEVVETARAIQAFLADTPNLRKATLISALDFASEAAEYSALCDQLEPLLEQTATLATAFSDPHLNARIQLLIGFVAYTKQDPDYPTAREAYRRGLDIERQQERPFRGERAHALVQALARLCELDREAFALQDSSAEAEEIAEILNNFDGPIDTDLIFAALPAAEAFGAVARYEDAKNLLGRLVERVDLACASSQRSSEDRIPLNETFAFALLLRDYGDILLSLPGSSEEAETALRRAGKILDPGDDNLDPDGPFLHVMLSLADALGAQGRLAEAMELRSEYAH